MDKQKVQDWYDAGQDYELALQFLRDEYVDTSQLRLATPQNFKIVKNLIFSLAECNEFDLILASQPPVEPPPAEPPVEPPPAEPPVEPPPAEPPV